MKIENLKTEISKMKIKLEKEVKKKWFYENFWQIEIRNLKDKIGSNIYKSEYNNAITIFTDWCENYEPQY